MGKQLNVYLASCQLVDTDLYCLQTANITEVEFTKSTLLVALDLRLTVIWRRDGGGWTVFQHRQDGKVDFFKGWEEYANGFGNLKTEFWLGNDKLYQITSRGQYELRVNLEDFNSDRAYAKYSSFYIGDRSTNYKLKVKGYSGTAGDSLTPHNNLAFTTKDKDNDSHSSANCAKHSRGAWWYYACHVSNLNGLYVGNKKDNNGMRWKQWKGSQSMKTTSMMIRRNRL
ncbi:Angiopoietin-related protein 1,Ficolin-1-A,Angiopoietin-1,Fibrinogen C domain-containing protein 1,Ryncolin-1,Tenascin-N,Angiopoietin-related protein 6,Ficolin-3,Fibrinogen C domain-containing protein 1-B,Fibroleukin,Fibrinogen-like protein 1,Ficolin-1,Ficolin-1-B,Angiopoietin-4,Tenascin-R,Ryncolin-2,Techylectin-5B,Fibrinogen C domain-containing protein 1-A,Microfibril-associated glycoprotein 4,Fibrinogen-like protein A,Ryncolin-3,Fibrinogen gamma chain,Angiopoietin-2,Tenascin-X,Ficolin-2,Fibrinogen alpha|uniref:Fibrinogen C-terminal domain-containing protein n=1 Tax=Mytilus edulis TaxID=6550 RepID=A0A8S3RYS3_MYTED|nr:Angiopoietin-related protein 1,Ficolin-1-A,Angiopoietin-1,Fibrinogen C domain-containing protein 1,Ryncolin-1,Tenascin-N,Angiopoietin-related protein 6,Ficolin-3,Fibrinogen C domain-containing protein 1-B,Fibroleukin,Fibrinogen-like protein 1,Ficolin-1,Ficolin-1-B,Angiopoietin-4,Tenascin-R,Ryncolin-2,Techylectin-5B,Fibrinogen C domain-containing protein 1-A,Microfibril-associated glycoprotein 4,Fibrinogen-like protein A,Ryncolin-3,Fibrinogen gamma chain,Angiopoietin-2,Tenascin-X,Ficolin-2,Fibrin